MKKQTFVLGVLLIIFASANSILVINKLSEDSQEWLITVGDLVALDLRDMLRTPSDTLQIALKTLVHDQPGVDETLAILNQMVTSGKISGGFITTGPNKIITTSSSPSIQDEEPLNNYWKVIQSRLDRELPVRGGKHFVDKDERVAWIIRPFQNNNSPEVLLVGMGFEIMQTLEPEIEDLITNVFMISPIQEWSIRLGSDHIAIELENPDGKTEYTIGDIGQKILTRTFTLDGVDLKFCGWRIHVWVASAKSSIRLWIALAAGLLGLALVLFACRR